jgi:hypothetical protein
MSLLLTLPTVIHHPLNKLTLTLASPWEASTNCLNFHLLEDEIDLSQFTFTLTNCNREIVLPKRGFTSFYLIGSKLPGTNVGSGAKIVAIEADNKTD